MFSKILIALLISSSAFASYESAERLYGKGSISLSGYRRTIIELVDSGYYFSAVPWMKDFLVKNTKTLDADLENAFDKMIYVTGVKPFETLPEDILARSRSGNIRYILAKRLLKRNQPEAALAQLNKVNGDHPAYPFVAHMRGTIYTILGKAKEAETQFKDCIRTSESESSDADSNLQKNQLLLNRDYCLAGIARVQFANKNYQKAELNYLDIQKSSFVWPEILFEEAWTSYYVKNYNRTLGKLVSYKAPVFDFVFKPEVDVLKALTFMKMCLYEDAKKTADDFYTDLFQPSKDLRAFINSRGKDYRYYYNLMADLETNKDLPLPIVGSILRSIKKEGAFIEMKGAFTSAIAEYNKLRKQRTSGFRSNLISNLKIVLEEYRTVLGAYVRSGMVSKYSELYSAFEGMSYIKLEILALRKEKLYQTDVTPDRKKRGDVKYIQRNDKQYFWTFNGEFWADELGDYVFALRSEC
jgi:tetratricopeptide (TPR) repeat protein